jgi:hypothetical protein
MPMLPIDLQTLFSNLNQVSKDQSVQKDEAVLQQSIAGTQIVKKSEENDNSVNETHEVKDGVENIKNEEKKGKAHTRHGKKSKEKKSIDRENSKEIVTDPLLGHHVDITG